MLDKRGGKFRNLDCNDNSNFECQVDGVESCLSLDWMCDEEQDCEDNIDDELECDECTWC